MTIASRTWRLAAAALVAAALVPLTGCSKGSDTPALPKDFTDCDSADFRTVLAAIPPQTGGGGGGTPTLRVHYKRLAADYEGWQLHTWLAAKDPGWGLGWAPTGTDAFGKFFDVELVASEGQVGYLFHKGDTKDHGGTDQMYTLRAGANEIWRIEADSNTYTSNPDSAAAPDLTTVRVHYLRYDGAFAQWGLHLWSDATSGLDAAALPSGLVINDWAHPIPLSAMPGYTAPAGGSEVTFDVPVLNPKDDPARKQLKFNLHGLPGGPPGGVDNKDGWPGDVTVSYSTLAVAGQVGEVWLIQEDPTVYAATPDLRSASVADARAYWLDRQTIKWPKVTQTGTFKLYASARGQLVAAKGAAVRGADSSITLEAFTGTVPEAVATRFKYVSAGALLSVKAADRAALPALLKGQLLLVQEDAAGLVQNATNAQLPGLLDDLYAPAAALNGLGVIPGPVRTGFKVWAPTAQQVSVCVYDTGSGKASHAQPLTFDAATGAWSGSVDRDLTGKYYKYLVDVFAPPVGLVRNRVTDPYSVSLTADSKRSYVADLSAEALKPAGWDATEIPATVQAQTDMVIYELHVRDFSANDATVPAAARGKYLAFAEAGSDGMKHLRALAQAGLTDVHLLPVFDLATVPEVGCLVPSIPAAAPYSEDQWAALAPLKDRDCFNWGYDPYHYTAPEGSYASDAADGARRVVEFRRMVQGLAQAGLRTGMDVVYNHTTKGGQDEKSVLDRIVPGYYHRLDSAGAITTSTCCANTATENAMMGKLLIDSVVTWAAQYKIASFRFDLMGHQPRAVMEALKAKLTSAVGREIQLLGEGWDFGEVAGGARFVQASQTSLNGSGIATFSDRARDRIRGGTPFDGGANLVKNQGFVTGLFYDDNGSGAGKTLADLLEAGDMVKVGLAGSIRTYPLVTGSGAVKNLEAIPYNGETVPAGYASEPTEVVNYVENHDNQTLYDIAVYKLPLATSTAERARVQLLAVALDALSQGVAYFHAGVELLRSKSMDQNSYDSGDWFNRLDWTLTDNYFGVGAPQPDNNSANYLILKPLLGNAALKPAPADMAYTTRAFQDWLAIRRSSTLFRLRTAEDVKTRLAFHNTGPAQVPTVVAGHLDGTGYEGAGFKEVLYLVNVDKAEHEVTIAAEQGKAYVLHPVQAAGGAADRRPAEEATYDAATGAFTVPPRTAVVWVVLP